MTDTEKRLGEIEAGLAEYRVDGGKGAVVSLKDMAFLLATVRGKEKARAEAVSAGLELTQKVLDLLTENARLRGALEEMLFNPHRECEQTEGRLTRLHVSAGDEAEARKALAGPEGGDAVVSIGHIHPEGETRPDCPMCPEPTDGGTAER